jgi:hypothetical protein
MPSSRLLGVAAALGAATALLVPTVASADNAVAKTVWHNLSCSEAQHHTFHIDADNSRVRLRVHHDWYQAGKLYVDHHGTSRVWEFDQPSNWIVGNYHVESKPLERGTYTAEMHAGNNSALHDGYCRSTLQVLKPGH